MKFAVAYGSAVFAQPGHIPDMTDLIFAVDDCVEWHAKNLALHRSHYSALKHLGPGVISRVQRMSGQMYFNPYVSIDGCNYKYGVISTGDLLSDLSDWSRMYVSGRLQKPVKILHQEEHRGEEIRMAMQKNLRSAVAMALLRLPPHFEEHQLYYEIASLSYDGDTRMSLSVEDPRKVQKIVSGSFNAFSEYYQHTLLEAPFGSIVNRKQTLWDQDISIDSCNALLAALPVPLQQHLQRIEEDESMSVGIKASRAVRESVTRKQLQNIVRWSSFGQTVKGLFTAGLGRSAIYALRKIRLGQRT
jgi:translocator assembly and maintenance protein 41